MTPTSGRSWSSPARVLQNPAENAALIAGLLAQQSRKAGHTALGLGLYCQPESGQLLVALADKNRIWNRRLSVTELRREDTQQIAAWAGPECPAAVHRAVSQAAPRRHRARRAG